MGKKRKNEQGEPQAIGFDVKARFKWLTGFRKRKLERRKKGLMEDLEAERKDLIDVRKQIREEVKLKWKEVQWAERRVDRLIADKAKELRDAKRKLNNALEDGNPGEGASAGVDTGAVEDAGPGEEECLELALPVPKKLKALHPLKPEAQSIVAFEEEEDDDPFGGCEVTTTAVEVARKPRSKQEVDDMYREHHEQILALTNGEGFGELVLAPPDEDPEVRAKRRAQNMALDEVRRKKALMAKVTKIIEDKKKAKKKRGKKKRKTKGKKATARERRNRKKK